MPPGHLFCRFGPFYDFFPLGEPGRWKIPFLPSPETLYDKADGSPDYAGDQTSFFCRCLNFRFSCQFFLTLWILLHLPNDRVFLFVKRTLLPVTRSYPPPLMLVFGGF